MAPHVCPWWMGYVLASPFRRWFQDPLKILAPFVKEGMTVLDVGCGMGFFTLEMARLVGDGGRVIAVDVQDKMLAGLRRRAVKQGLSDRIQARLCGPDHLGLSEPVDFALSFAVAHEVPDAKSFFLQIAAVLKPGGSLLLAEPKLPVSEEQFRALVEDAVAAGLRLAGDTGLGVGRNALFKAD
jgi:ubiquinone/menaquinone biosynthesis C-methylase UbiE